MAKLVQVFDATSVDPTQTLGGLPIGKHPVVIINSEVKPTKNNDAGYLQLDLQIIDGPSKGAVGAWRLNLYHSNRQTVEIAYRQLSALCHVIGVYQVQDSQQLHNIPFVVEVGLQKGENPEKYTEVKRVLDMNGNEPGHMTHSQAAPASAQPQPQSPTNGQSWGASAASPVANNVPVPPVAPAAAPGVVSAPVNASSGQGWGNTQAPAGNAPAGGQSWGAPAQPQSPTVGGWDTNGGSAPWGNPSGK